MVMTDHHLDKRRLRRRLEALGALLLLVILLVATAAFVWNSPGRVIAALVLVLVAVASAWMAVTGRSRHRLLWLATALASAAGGAFLLVLGGDGILAVPLVIVLGALSIALMRRALRPLPAGHRVPPPARPVLFVNLKSGGGKAEQFDLVSQARARNVEPIVLQPGDDLEVLAEDAVHRGADCLGMAGGDGSQAIVAGVAAAHDLPYVLVPSGTRNHFALDLGVNRDDVVGALDAFVDGRERRVDLAEVNGRVFVNNVSLGVYAKVVQSPEYRDAKLQTAASMLPVMLGADAEPLDLRIDAPGRAPVEGPQVAQISNNPYRLSRLAGFGTRPSLTTGLLGIATLQVNGAADVAKLVALETAGHVDRFRGFERWSSVEATVTSAGPVEAGVDGEAMLLDPPLQFRIRHRALRIRVAPSHPGVSPSAGLPDTLSGTLTALARLVVNPG
jgi:diacylglycerol kinase family enzyme